ncbi:hypothetical protein Patl1_24243 [Pistacia atlantica]|uniref:Uncharacterized protein n=1 Tax=Pistacia atlantica TaxID=434234 RepID=A0ACC1A0I0_9ROSI|nr:hypothetical protein Patl1_24243 [Pistacia atlantica]
MCSKQPRLLSCNYYHDCIFADFDIDDFHATCYMGALFFGLIILLVDCILELSLTTARLPVFFKQKELCFYPAWAYAIPASLFKIPLLVTESVTRTCLIMSLGKALRPRGFALLILCSKVFPSAHSTFRRAPYLYIYVSVFRISLPDSGCCHDSRGFAVLIVLLFCGFVITHSSNAWVVEVGFLVSPLTYGEIGLSVNEFLAPRWQKVSSYRNTFWFLSSRKLCNNLLNANAAPGSSLQEKLAKIQGSRDSNEDKHVEERSKNSPMKGDFNFLLSVGWSYFLNHLISNISGCEEKKKLQLLSDVTSALRPGVHTALMGVSGAGKSTLLYCMAGRKTTGHIKGQTNFLNLFIVSWLLSYKLIVNHTTSKPNRKGLTSLNEHI